METCLLFLILGKISYTPAENVKMALYHFCLICQNIVLTKLDFRFNLCACFIRDHHQNSLLILSEISRVN